MQKTIELLNDDWNGKSEKERTLKVVAKTRRFKGDVKTFQSLCGAELPFALWTVATIDEIVLEGRIEGYSLTFKSGTLVTIVLGTDYRFLENGGWKEVAYVIEGSGYKNAGLAIQDVIYFHYSHSTVYLLSHQKTIKW